MPTRILLADDHEIVRQGLKALLERAGFSVVAEAADGQEAVRVSREQCPDVAVLDFGMPLLNGLGAARQILRACPRAKAVLLTVHTEDHYVPEALQAGVKGYVVKTQAGVDLVRAISHRVLGLVSGTVALRGPTDEVLDSEEFRATMTGWKGDNSDREELRLLPRPLYRYDIKEPSEVNPNLQDGALLGFVMGTDPEVVMVLEAVSRDGRSVWQYAFARATSGGLEARLDGKVVWVAEKYPGNRGPNNPQLTLGRPLEE